MKIINVGNKHPNFKAMKVACLAHNPEILLKQMKAFWGAENFTQSHLSTLGSDITIKQVKMDGKTLELQIWVLAIQLGFKNLRDRYLRNAVCYVWYDPKEELPEYLFKQILDHVNTESIQDQSKIQTNHSIPLCLFYVGNLDRRRHELINTLKNKNLIRVVSQADFLSSDFPVRLHKYYAPHIIF